MINANKAPQVLSSPCRRRFLKMAAAATTVMIGPAALAGIPGGERRIGFYNLHTGERLSTVYWQNGRYLPGSMGEINHLLRDHRTGDERAMDPALMDLLHLLQNKTGNWRDFEVISGYRSLATNALLRTNSSGVARRSLHMEGKAIDIRLPGIRLQNLRHAALSLRQGGVGYYPSSGFVHLDTGRVRSW